MNRHELGETIFEKMRARYDVKEQILGAPAMRYHERIVMLSVLDGLWKDHLLAMDHLKEGIGLRGYAQQDPLVAYKKESFEMFEAMMMQFQQDTARHLFRMQIIGPDGKPIETVEQMPQRGPADASGIVSRRQQRLPMPGQASLPMEMATAVRAPTRAGADSDARSLDDDRRVGARVPAQEEARTGAGAAGGRRREHERQRTARDRREGRAQRSLPMRFREEVQEVPRGAGVRSQLLVDQLRDWRAVMSAPNWRSIQADGYFFSRSSMRSLALVARFFAPSASPELSAFCA